VNARWLIVDGYSLMHRDPGFAHRRASLSLARQKLVRKIEEVGGSLADRVTVVFDGTQSGAGEGYESSAIEVLFSPSDQTADTVIERAVLAAGDAEAILVVTSDRAERDVVSAAGAHTMSCGDFIDLMERQGRNLSAKARQSGRRIPRSTLGEHFPKG
jgi:predicted RNA-binding protein with PIN domain